MLDKTLVVFHSYKMSFAAWQKAGILERELVLYRAMKQHFKKILFVSYAQSAQAEQALAHGDFEVLANEKGIHPFKYAHAIAALHKDRLAEADILRINQMSGMMGLGSTKKMFPEKKLVIRCGFMWSRFQRHRNILKKWVVSKIERWGFSLADRIILTSESDLQYIVQKYNANSEHITIIRNLIDTDLFKPSTIKPDPKKICAVGRLESQKNYPALIRALAGSDYQLDIFGQGSLRSELEKLAAQHKVNVRFRGVIPNTELATELAQYSALVIASEYEGNPKSLLEAMSSGLPVIASDIPHHRDIIISGRNGLLVGSDQESLRAAIAKVTSDAALREKLGASARQWILDNCSLKVVLAQELNMYERLAN